MDSLNYVKLCSIFGLLSGSVGILWSHQQGDIWPGIHLSLLAAIAFMILLLKTNREFSATALLLPISLGVFLRLYTYVFPASMIGFDPDTYAFQIQGIIVTGSTEAVQGSYYTAAPLFHVLAAAAGLVSEIPATKAMAIYPVLTGILYPLVTFLLVRRFIDDLSIGSWGGFAGGLIVAVATMSVNLAYQPIAETLAALQWIVLVYVVMRFIDGRSWRSTGMFLLLLTALIFTHKLPPTAVLVTFVILSLGILAIWMSGVNVWEGRKGALFRTSVYLTLIAGGFVVLQYFFISALGGNLAFRLFTYLDPQSQSALYSASLPATDAVPIGLGLSQRIIRNLHGLVLIPIAAVSWLVLAIGVLRGRFSKSSVLVILAVAASTSLVMLLTLTGPTIGGGVGRTLVIAEPVLISVTILAVYRRPWLIQAIVLLLVLTQLTSGITIAPDYREGADMYLTNQDLAAKDHGWKFVDETIYTDSFYANEMLPSRINRYQRFEKPEHNSHYAGFNDGAFLNGTLIWQEYAYILFRNKTKFRTNLGWYQITWDPKKELNHRNNRVYDNNGVMLYVEANQSNFQS